MQDCLFCKIIAGELPSTKIYEDDYVYAFEDIDKQAPVHVVVVPKNHYKNITEVKDSSQVGKIFDAINKIVEQLDVKNGFRVVCNTGEDGGQTVEHLHFHLMAGRKFGWPAG
ncbi:histidine triad nucleotide-binding protein [Criibacterium bergeronii]|uniref:Histidine triad nucleotide-binding protein n=1 Tax=Criibacterium bergeronii TaxID=1871336 RepID=A0A371INC5_9FIRM|nr:histidine triad nucleotide-binding protein [Criibacterium bergeronii]MBS6063295.1 histidine triad nucleotide-binding protein [Peptostreptococcaceae bacterium]RDY21993.1 histidine triad nucleotide-binding protein [Criibacterium bergeronii]